MPRRRTRRGGQMSAFRARYDDGGLKLYRRGYVNLAVSAPSFVAAPRGMRMPHADSGGWHRDAVAALGCAGAGS